MIRYTEPQLEALGRAASDEALSRALVLTLHETTDPELHAALAARYQRMLDDALVIRETVGFIDPRVYSRVPARRRRAAATSQATTHTWAALADDRSATVRAAVVKGHALRETRFPAPGGAVGDRDTEALEIADPMSFVTG